MQIDVLIDFFHLFRYYLECLPSDTQIFHCLKNESSCTSMYELNISLEWGQVRREGEAPQRVSPNRIKLNHTVNNSEKKLEDYFSQRGNRNSRNSWSKTESSYKDEFLYENSLSNFDARYVFLWGA